MDLAGISNLTTAATALSNLILVSPQKTVGYQAQNAPSWKKDTTIPPAAILFNYEGENVAEMSSDVTDHYIENNTSVQDQVSLRPIIVRTNGFVGELNNVAPAALVPVQQLAQKLVSIGAYTPQLSATAALAYSEAFFAYQIAMNIANTAVSSWSTINGKGGQSVINGSGITPQPNQTKQQEFFQQFYGYWQKRTLFTIQTPWAIFQDMVIMNLNAVQDPETRVITDFNLTFKQLRFATTLQDPNTLNSSNFQGRAGFQSSSLVDLGTSALEPSSQSFLGAL